MISLDDWEMRSGRNSASAFAHGAESLDDWEMRSGRNYTRALPYTHASLDDWEMRSGRNNNLKKRDEPVSSGWRFAHLSSKRGNLGLDSIQ